MSQRSFKAVERFCHTENIDHLSDVKPEDKQKLLQAAHRARELHGAGEGISAMFHRRAGLIINALYKPEPFQHVSCRFQLLINYGASCYLDSALFAIFISAPSFITDNVLNAAIHERDGPTFVCTLKESRYRMESLNEQYDKEPSTELDEKIGVLFEKNKNQDVVTRTKIQDRLKSIYESIHGGELVETCSSLRQSFRGCPTSDNYASAGIKESGDFLGFIFSLFDTDKSRKIITTYGINRGAKPVRTSRRVIDTSVIISIPSYILSKLDSKQNHYIGQFLTKMEDSGHSDDNKFKLGDGDAEGTYTRMVVKEDVVSSPYLVFDVSRRRDLSNRVLHRRIYPAETVTLQDERMLFLSSIVVYQGVHYTVYVKCGGTWFYYDDLGPSFDKVGDYDQLLNSHPSPITNGTLYIYRAAN
jgi:hypothetical protein